MLYAFELTFPNFHIWNGLWSGEGERYIKIRAISKRSKAKPDTIYIYNFEDGWAAKIEVSKVDSKQAQQLRKISQGFQGYEWMIKEIDQYGYILLPEERRQINEYYTQTNE